MSAARRLRGIAAAGALALTGPVLAAPLSELESSADVHVEIDGSTLADEDAARDDGSAAPVAVTPLLPGDVDLVGYQALPGDVSWLALDTTAELPGGLVATPRDVVRVAGSVFSLEFDGAAAGLPDGARIDALSRDESGRLVLSFDVSTPVADGLADDEDLVVRDSDGELRILLDTSAAGIPESLDLDAVDASRAGVVLASFDGSGEVDGASFDDEDVLEWDPLRATWELVWDGSARSGAWRAADLDALGATVAGSSADADADGVADDVDNCPAEPNADQADASQNGIGDACECGDFTGDGLVNSIDARLIQRCSVGLLECAGLCDVTGEGACNSIDARLVQRHAVGLIAASALSCAERPAP